MFVHSKQREERATFLAAVRETHKRKKVKNNKHNRQVNSIYNNNPANIHIIEKDYALMNVNRLEDYWNHFFVVSVDAHFTLLLIIALSVSAIPNEMTEE